MIFTSLKSKAAQFPSCHLLFCLLSPFCSFSAAKWPVLAINSPSSSLLQIEPDSQSWMINLQLHGKSPVRAENVKQHKRMLSRPGAFSCQIIRWRHISSLKIIPLPGPPLLQLSEHKKPLSPFLRLTLKSGIYLHFCQTFFPALSTFHISVTVAAISWWARTSYKTSQWPIEGEQMEANTFLTRNSQMKGFSDPLPPYRQLTAPKFMNFRR